MNAIVDDYVNGTVHAIIFSSLLFSYLFLITPTRMLKTSEDVSEMSERKHVGEHERT